MGIMDGELICEQLDKEHEAWLTINHPPSLESKWTVVEPEDAHAATGWTIWSNLGTMSARRVAWQAQFEDTQENFSHIVALHNAQVGLSENPYEAGYEQGMEEAYHADLSDCPYYQRRFVGGNGICNYGCSEEPECQTCEPSGGWPEAKRTTQALITQRVRFAALVKDRQSSWSEGDPSYDICAKILKDLAQQETDMDAF